MTVHAYTTYECSVILAALAAGAVGAAIQPGTQGDPGTNINVRMGLLRLEVILTTAVASSLALSTANGGGVATTNAFGNKVGDVNGGYAFGAVPNMGRVSSAWSAAPTIGSKLLRRDGLPATIGAAFVWEWPETNPLTVNMDRGIFTDTGLVLHNFGAGASGAMLVNARWMEYNGNPGG